MAHTPGPWMAADKPSSIVGWPVVAPRDMGRSICNITVGHEHSDANARLIAAAPELLEQLNIASGWIGTEIINIGPCDHGVGICTCGDRAMLADIRAAIAKATGGAS